MKRWVLLVPLLVLAGAVTQSSAKEKPKPEPKPAVVVVNLPMADRPLLAVVAFDDGSVQRQTWWGPSWDVGSGLANILVTRLLEANRFRLLERSLLDQIMKEQDLGATTRVDAKTAAKIGKIVGADYLIMGKVTEFAWETKSGGGVAVIGGIFGAGVSNTKARVAVDIRVVDAETAEILGSYSGKDEESRSKFVIAQSRIGALAIGSSDFMQSILGIATKKAIDQWTDNFCKAQDDKKLILQPKHRAPVRPDGVVLSVEGNTIISNIGTAKGYAVGDKVEIRRKGKELKDPDTGEVLRVISDLACVGKITRIDEKTADIQFEKGAITPAEGFLVKYVAPPVEKTPAPAAATTPDPKPTTAK